MTNQWPQGGQAKSSDVNGFMALFAEKQREANRIEAQFDKLLDRCVAGPDYIWGLLTPQLEFSDGEYMSIEHEAGRYTAAFGMRGRSGGDPSWGDEAHRFIQPSPENAALVAKSYCDYFSRRIKP